MKARASALAPIILLALLAWLPAGCGKGDSAASAPSANATSAPAAEERGDRYCIWLLWSRDQTLTAEAAAELGKGRPFMLVAREVNLRHPGQSTLNADCLPAAGLDPYILAAVKDLALGEASPAFALRGGSAIVMRTTDRHRRRGQSLYEQGNLAEAEKALLEDLRLHPASAPTWHLLALIRARSGDREGALRAFDQALLFAPRDSAVMNDKATTLSDLGRSAEAQALYEDALHLDPANPTLKANLAWGLAQADRDLARAEALAQEAVAAAPEQAAMWNTLGRVQQARGELGAAVASFHRAARLDPKGAQARERLLASILALSPETVERLAEPGGRTSPLPTAKASQAARAAAALSSPLSRPANGQASPLAPQAGSAPQAEPAPRAGSAPQAAPAPQASASPAKPPQQEQGEVLRTYQPEPITVHRPWSSAGQAPAPQAARAQRLPQAQTPQDDPAPGFYLQVSSYFVADLAQKEAEAWRRRGQRALVEPLGIEGKIWHRVMLGPYANREQAQAAGEGLKARRLVASFFVVEL
jgi:tetratricopeptide (TPR) repeat protein